MNRRKLAKIFEQEVALLLYCIAYFFLIVLSKHIDSCCKDQITINQYIQGKNT